MKVAVVELANPRVRSATETQTCDPSSHQRPPANPPDATDRLPPLHPSRPPLTTCHGQEPATICTRIPETSAPPGPRATRSPRYQQHDATGHAAETATTRRGRRAAIRIKIGKARSAGLRAQTAQEVCRRRAAIGATSSRAPKCQHGASAARLGVKASRSFQARQVRP